MKYLTVLFVLLFSCQDHNYTLEQCEGLSTAAFRGLPKEARAFNKGCQKYQGKLKYTRSVCQKALQAMILNGNQTGLEKQFGSRILECFNEGDKEKWLKGSK